MELLDRTVPAINLLLARTVPANKLLLAGTFPANKFLLAGSPKNFFKKCLPLNLPHSAAPKVPECWGEPCTMRGTGSLEYCNFSHRAITDWLEIKVKKFERNTSLTQFLFHFISYVVELWTYLHCYLKNGNNVNHCEIFYSWVNQFAVEAIYSWVELISSGSNPFIVVANELIRYNFQNALLELSWVELISLGSTKWYLYWCD